MYNENYINLNSLTRNIFDSIVNYINNYKRMSDLQYNQFVKFSVLFYRGKKIQNIL